jgi:SAM-dependent methyltransferase
MKVKKEEYDYLTRMITASKKNDNLEMEASFYNPMFLNMRKQEYKVTSNEYLRVKQMLTSSGFEYLGNDKILRVFYPSDNRLNNIRVSIEGEEAIEFYCNKGLLPMDNFIVEQKTSADEIGARLYMQDLNCRVNLKQEIIIPTENEIFKHVIRNDRRAPKYFRLLERLSFTTKDGIFRFDISCVRSNFFGKPSISFSKSNTLSSNRNYEIELELVDNTKDNRTIVKSLYKHISMYHNVITEFKGIMRADKQVQIMQQYLTLIKASQDNFWIGPKPVSLEHINMTNNANIPNITNEYCITDKADGLRCLIYVNNDKKCYAITMNSVIFDINAECDKPNTIIDCEYIFEDKSGNRVEMFALFDIYYVDGKSVKELPFIAQKGTPSRQSNMTQLKFKTTNPRTIIRPKKYYTSSPKKSIWKTTKEILDNIEQGAYAYHTDGIIYQPMSLVVGGTTSNNQVPLNTGKTWKSVFKWKPSDENTIDFLVRYDRRKIKRSFNHNKNTVEYLVSGLLYINSNEQDKCDLMYRERYDERARNHEALFKPQKPALEDSYKMNMFVTKKTDLPTTTIGEPIEDKMVVECTYNFNNEKGFHWVPMRIRHDKTQQYRSRNRRMAMNFITTANSIWTLIHNPITKEMISTGDFEKDDNMRDVENLQQNEYYRRVGRREDSRMITLQRFHNQIIKSERMIKKYVKEGQSLLDIACGKGGDMGKWIDSKVGFVLGVDINSDNIRGAVDSACSRYVSFKNKRNNVPDMAFMVTDAKNDIKEPSSYDHDFDKVICRSVFEGVDNLAEAREYSLLNKISGIGQRGFDVVEMMFAIHYSFKNRDTFEGLMNNITENIKPGGIFMFNCLNGKKVRNLLKDRQKGEMYQSILNEKMLWGISKNYEEDNDEPFGNSINVYVESINALFEEYLVDFDFVEQEFVSRGFEKVEIVDFEDVHGVDQNQQKYNMTKQEQDYCYLHTYAIFRKVN